MVAPQVQLTREFLEVGCEILGLDPRSRLSSVIELFRSNFKYSPSRCAFLFEGIVDDPMLPRGYQPKHLLWTLYFLLTYAKERVMCCFLRADRKTIRKYTWPTISIIANLSHQHVSCAYVPEIHKSFFLKQTCIVRGRRFVGRTDLLVTTVRQPRLQWMVRTSRPWSIFLSTKGERVTNLITLDSGMRWQSVLPRATSSISMGLSDAAIGQTYVSHAVGSMEDSNPTNTTWQTLGIVAGMVQQLEGPQCHVIESTNLTR